MKVLFLTADLGGNVPPTLAVAEELARRGVGVEVAGLAEGRTPLCQPVFHPALSAGPEQSGRGIAKALPMLRLMAGRTTCATTERLVAERRADAVAVDCMLPAVLEGALRSGAPVAALFHTVGEYWIRSFDGGAGGLFSEPWASGRGRSGNGRQHDCSSRTGSSIRAAMIRPSRSTPGRARRRPALGPPHARREHARRFW